MTIIYGGSFNPIHNAHLEMAKEALSFSKDNSIIFVITNNHAFGKNLPSIELRKELVEKAIKIFSEHDYNVNVKIMEKYTWDFIQTLPKEHYEILIGSDNLVDFHKWKNYEDLLEHHEFLIANRAGEHDKHRDIFLELGMFGDYFEMEEKYKTISSSLIRQRIKNGESIVDLVPDDLIEEIERLYKNLVV